MTRAALPDRRPAVTETVEWGGRSCQICVGFDAAGRARELFLDGQKVGSDIEALLDDACVAVSLLLQHGVSAARLAEHLGREGSHPGAPAASLLGLAVARVAAVERDCGAPPPGGAP